ncbi:hypothetical protein B0H13DRAFT_2542238 [Mycena leptocephala]|nr:hypothetical protein B0H13DRAFT_2542238 [Mycena leptocephala]
MSDSTLDWIWSKYTTSPDPASGMQSLHRTCSLLTKHVLHPSDIILSGGSFTLRPDLAVPLTDVVPALDHLLKLAAKLYGFKGSSALCQPELKVLTCTTGFIVPATLNQIVWNWIHFVDKLYFAMVAMKSFCKSTPLPNLEGERLSQMSRTLLSLPPSLRSKLPKDFLESYGIMVLPLPANASVAASQKAAAASRREDSHSYGPTCPSLMVLGDVEIGGLVRSQESRGIPLLEGHEVPGSSIVKGTEHTPMDGSGVAAPYHTCGDNPMASLALEYTRCSGAQASLHERTKSIAVKRSLDLSDVADHGVGVDPNLSGRCIGRYGLEASFLVSVNHTESSCPQKLQAASPLRSIVVPGSLPLERPSRVGLEEFGILDYHQSRVDQHADKLREEVRGHGKDIDWQGSVFLSWPRRRQGGDRAWGLCIALNEPSSPVAIPTEINRGVVQTARALGYPAPSTGGTWLDEDSRQHQEQDPLMKTRTLEMHVRDGEFGSSTPALVLLKGSQEQSAKLLISSRDDALLTLDSPHPSTPWLLDPALIPITVERGGLDNRVSSVDAQRHLRRDDAPSPSRLGCIASLVLSATTVKTGKRGMDELESTIAHNASDVAIGPCASGMQSLARSPVGNGLVDGSTVGLGELAKTIEKKLEIQKKEARTLDLARTTHLTCRPSTPPLALAPVLSSPSHSPSLHSVFLSVMDFKTFALVSAIVWTGAPTYLACAQREELAPCLAWAREGIGTPSWIS